MTRVLLNCGYVPLVDCAPLVLAQELGFAADEGIELNLLRQPSWAALRDLLSLGHLEAAHILAPMPLAMSLGLSGQKTQVEAVSVLSANGTVVGASAKIVAQMADRGWQRAERRADRTISALFGVLDRPVRVGVPFPYSMHRLLFEYLVAGTKDRIEGAYEIVTTPPPLMADAVARGELDVFFVGEPWGTVAVQSGHAELLFPGNAIWAHAPEKVLGTRVDWGQAHPGEQAALARAVYRASHWLGQPENVPLASDLLSKSRYLNLPEAVIDASFRGEIAPRRSGEPWHIQQFLKFHSEATTFPWRSLGAWIGAQIAKLNHLDPQDTIARGAACFRPDLYRNYLANSDADFPGASSKIEGTLARATKVLSKRGDMILGPDQFFDGKTFDFGAI